MTEGPNSFITAVTMQALSNPPGFGSAVGRAAGQQHGAHQPEPRGRRHPDRACSADFMAKLLHGGADELLSLMCLARPIDKVPLLIARP